MAPKTDSQKAVCALEGCDKPLPGDARPDRLYCEQACRREANNAKRRKPVAPVVALPAPPPAAESAKSVEAIAPAASNDERIERAIEYLSEGLYKCYQAEEWKLAATLAGELRRLVAECAQVSDDDPLMKKLYAIE